MNADAQKNNGDSLFHVEQIEPIFWKVGNEGKSKYHIESDCGLYSCCKVRLGERLTHEAWGRAHRGGNTVQLAVGLATMEEAQQVCEAHKHGARGRLHNAASAAGVW